MERDAADPLLSELGCLIGLPALRFDAQGCCQLMFDERWLVTLVRHEPRRSWYLHCPISEADATQQLDTSVLRTMLQGNFMGRGVAGGTLAIGQDRQACVQCELPFAEADARSLLDAVERLLASAQAWAGRLRSSEDGRPSARRLGPAFTRSLA